jgi:AraC-like DNA-binding protein
VVVTRISTDEVPAGQKVRYWLDALDREFMHVELNIDDEETFSGLLIKRELGQICIFGATSRSVRGALRDEHLIHKSGARYYELDLQKRGARTVTQEGRQVTAVEGDLVLYDTSQPYQLLLSDEPVQESVMLTIPVGLMPPVAQQRGSGPVLLSGQTANGALVASLMNGLAEHLTDNDQSVTGGFRLYTGIIEVVAASLPDPRGAAPDSDDPFRRVLLTRACSFIEDHLSDHQLAPALVARAVNVSLRQLQKLFAAEDSTVAEWIRDRRLSRCRRDLMDQTLSRIPVSSIGVRWGFSNPSHFSKLFRAKYGLPPSDYRRCAASGAARH